MFLRLSTQWVTDTGCYVGLNYASVESLLRIYSVDNPAAMFEALQTMETAALEELSKNDGK
jgi:hypothetical protein